jgi:hypothetical protein
MTHFLRMGFIRLLIVACGMLYHSSSMAVRSCWILAGTGTHCCTHWIRASQTCPMGDMSGIQAMEELGHYQLPGIVYRSLQHGALNYHAETWDEWHNNGPQDLITVSLCIQIAIDKMQFCSLSVAYACPCHNPTATMGYSVHNVDTSKPLADTTPYVCHLPRYSWNWDSFVKSTRFQRASGHQRWAFAHWSRLRLRTEVR